jgi:FecR protein
LFKQRSMWKIVLGVLGGLCIALVLGLSQVPAVAQINLATIQEIVDGDQVFIEQNLAKVSDVANLQQKVATQESRAALLFSNGSAGRMGPNSEIVVGQCIEVQQGLLLASGPANGCTTTFEVGVQGTVYVLEVDRRGQSNVKVLEGEVQVSKADSPEAIAIAQGKRLEISPDGVFGKILDLSQEDVEAILNGALFNGFQIPIPGMGRLQEALQSLYPNINLPRLPGFNLPGLPGPRIPGLPF